MVDELRPRKVAVTDLDDDQMARLAARRADVYLSHLPLYPLRLVRWGGTNKREQPTARVQNLGGGRFTVPKTKVRHVVLPDGFAFDQP